MATRTPTKPLSAVSAPTLGIPGGGGVGTFQPKMVWTPISDATGPSRHLRGTYQVAESNVGHTSKKTAPGL